MSQTCQHYDPGRDFVWKMADSFPGIPSNQGPVHCGGILREKVAIAGPIKAERVAPIRMPHFDVMLNKDSVANRLLSRHPSIKPGAVIRWMGGQTGERNGSNQDTTDGVTRPDLIPESAM